MEPVLSLVPLVKAFALPGLSKRATPKALAEEYFDNVETVSAGSFKHNKLNSTEHFLEASDEAELLIVCTNNE